MPEQEYGPKTHAEAIRPLRSILAKVIEEAIDNPEPYEKLITFVNIFRPEHPDFADYELYHLLTLGAAGDDRPATKWDTENHEIENFIRSLETK